MSHGSLEVLKGTLDMLVLQVLAAEPAHGYAIGKEIEERSGATIRLTTGALYQALKRMRDDGLVEPAPEETAGAGDARRRYFRLTERGREVVALEAARLERLLDAARASKLYPFPG